VGFVTLSEMLWLKRPTRKAGRPEEPYISPGDLEGKKI